MNVPLDQDTAWLAKIQTDTATRVLELVDSKFTERDALTLVARVFIERMVGAQNAMGCIGTYLHPKYEVRFDMMALLRNSYETHLQALYVTANPELAVIRAQTFLDYDAVDKLDMLRLWQNNRSRFSAEMLRRVDARPNKEQDIAELEAIAARFKTAPGMKRPIRTPGGVAAFT